VTLSLASITYSGIVLTADSRQTYRNVAGMTRIGTDNAVKLFELNRKAGVVVAGRAFFPDAKGAVKDVGWFIEDFRENVLKGQAWPIKQLAVELNEYLTKVFIEPEEARIADFLTKQIQTDGGRDFIHTRTGSTIDYSFTDKDAQQVQRKFFIDTIGLIVAGYDADGVGHAYLVQVPNVSTFERNTVFGGVLWIGQSEVVCRVILGYAGELHELGFVKDAAANAVNVQQELEKLEYIINWGSMTLQDSIDICVLLTKTTESIQRFSDGSNMHPGGITGVGGHINVATITPADGFRWINKRDLVVSD